MIPQPLPLRGHRAITFNATTTDYNYGALDSRFDTGPMTILALVRAVGSGEGGFGYICGKTPSASINGLRFFVDHNTNNPRLTFAVHSASSSFPTRTTNTISGFYNRWYWVAATFDGGATASTAIRIFYGDQRLAEATYVSATNGSLPINTDSANNWHIGNRQNSDRTFNGEIAVVCRWNTVLPLAVLNRAINDGPLTILKSKQAFMWFAGRDLSPNAWRQPTVTAAAYSRSVPYAVDAVARPVWASALGLSAVSSDADIRWDVLAAVSKDSDLRWSLLNAIQKDADLRWSLLAALQKDADLRWDIVSAIFDDLDIRWDIQSSSTVTKDLDTRWDVLSSLLKDADFRWNVLTAIQKDSSLIWGLLAAVSKDADLRWDILSSLTSISKDVDLRWSIIAQAVKDLSAQWNVLTSVAKDETLIWNIATAAARDIDLRWDVTGGLASITKDASFMWAIVNGPTKDLTLQWVVQTESGAYIKSRYIYVLPDEKRVFVLRPENLH